MAAPPETHQEFIIRTAEIGEATSRSLIKFAAQYSTNQLVLLNLATAFDLISVNLHSLSTTLSTYGPKIELSDSLTIQLVARIKDTFEKVGKALEEGVEAEKDYGDEWEDLERVGAVAGERFRAGARHSNMYNHAGCVRFMRALGGLEAAEELVWELEELKGHVFYLMKGVRYLGLKKIESEESLDAVEKATLRKLVAEIVDLSKQLEWRKGNLESLAKKWKAGGDLAQQQPRRADEVVIIPRRDRIIDDDARSWRSVDSFESDCFIDSNELYECWAIRRIEGYPRRTERSWTFFGFKVNENLNNEVYAVDAMPCSQDGMKNKYEFSKTGEGSPVFAKRIASLPGGVYREIEWLVQERARISTVPRRVRTWKLVDVKPTAPIIPRQPAGWWSWMTGKVEVEDYLIVLKAESSSGEGLTYPNRMSDPFRKAQHLGRVRRSRSPVGRVRDVVVEERYERGPTTASRPRGDFIILPDPTPEEAHSKIEEALAGIVASRKEDVAA